MAAGGHPLYVSFKCQKCQGKIIFDHSYKYADKGTLDEVHPLGLSPLPSSLQLQQDCVGAEASENCDSSSCNSHTPEFNLVGGSAVCSHYGQVLSTQQDLHDIVEDKTEIDGPLCENCSDTLLTLVESETRAADKECRKYEDFLNQLKSEPDDGYDIEALEKQLKELQTEQSELAAEIEDLKATEAAELKSLEEFKISIDNFKRKEEECLKLYCERKHKLNKLEDDSNSLVNEICQTEVLLEKVEKKDPLVVAFRIAQTGHFGVGVINDLKLGQLPSEPVGWNEINAAWGQCALLLDALARKLEFKFSNYRIIPYGNTSFIKVRETNKKLPLYRCVGSRSVLWYVDYDKGMTAFLDCLSQLESAINERLVQSKMSKVRLPYRMPGYGRIEDRTLKISYSIKIMLNTPENWTKALKCMLNNLNFALAWVTSEHVQEEVNDASKSSTSGSHT